MRNALGDRNAFLVLTNNIHFHPDLSLGGFGFLIVTQETAKRRTGVYLLHPTRKEWLLAYEISDLPPAEWVQITDWAGDALPLQLFVINSRDIAARWLSRTGSSIAPGEWDISGGPSSAALEVARNEHEMISRNIGRI